jgi:hypothetical protein
MSRAQDAKVNYTSGEIVAILFNARGIKLSVEDVAFAAKVIDDYAASRCAPVEAQLEQAQLALGDAAREINVAGPVDHRIRILKTEWSRTILRLQEEKRAAESEVTKLREALRRAINFIEETADGMCVNPATMKDLREFRQWKNMPQDPEFDWILLEDVNLREDK